MDTGAQWGLGLGLMETDGWILIGGAGRGTEETAINRTRNVDYLTLAERRRRGENGAEMELEAKEEKDPGGVQVVEWGCMFVSNAMLACLPQSLRDENADAGMTTMFALAWLPDR